MTGFAIMSMTGFAILSTTVADAAAAGILARALIEAGLAACVQVVPITSVYRWQVELVEASEQSLSCKIAANDYDAVAAAIRARHAYQVPEIVMTPIVAGDPPYLA